MIGEIFAASNKKNEWYTAFGKISRHGRLGFQYVVKARGKKTEQNYTYALSM